MAALGVGAGTAQIAWGALIIVYPCVMHDVARSAADPDVRQAERRTHLLWVCQLVGIVPLNRKRRELADTRVRQYGW